MKNAISNIWLIGLVFLFILLFSAYLAITISYTSAFKIKNEMLLIVEKHDGFTNSTGKQVNSVLKTGKKVKGSFGALQTIALYLNGSGYRAKGTCPNGWYGVTNLDHTTSSKSAFMEKVTNTKKKYYYCFTRLENNSSSNSKSRFYKIRLFYKMNLPVLGDIFTFKIDGTTTEIAVPSDAKTFST